MGFKEQNKRAEGKKRERENEERSKSRNRDLTTENKGMVPRGKVGGGWVEGGVGSALPPPGVIWRAETLHCTPETSPSLHVNQLEFK